MSGGRFGFDLLRTDGPARLGRMRTAHGFGYAFCAEAEPWTDPFDAAPAVASESINELETEEPTV